MLPETLALLKQQYNAEATDEIVYARLAQRLKGENKEILLRMSADEARHCKLWGHYVEGEPEVSKFKLSFYTFLGRVLGITFLINKLEQDEKDAATIYALLSSEVPEAAQILEDEVRHEAALASMIKEEKLDYIGSIMLGLSDALVELTGALAGFTLALGSNSLVGLAGFITGVAATLSMAASEYLSNKAEGGNKHPVKAATYTGIAYMFTVAMLLIPYTIFTSPFLALGLCLFNAALIIGAFTYFVSVVQKHKFKPKFLEMLTISFSVAAISFLIGWAARTWMGLDL